MTKRADADATIAAEHLEGWKFSPMQGLNPNAPTEPPAEKEHRLLLRDTFAKVRADERARIVAALRAAVSREPELARVAGLTIVEACDLVARSVQ